MLPSQINPQANDTFSMFDSFDFHGNIALEPSQHLEEEYSDYHSLHSPEYTFSHGQDSLQTISSSEPTFNQQEDYYSQLQIEYLNSLELSDSSSQTTRVRCSLINDNSAHNYPMDNNIKSNAPKYCQLTDEMLNKVELYHQCHIQHSKIINLLESKYSDHPIKSRNVYNIISKLKDPGCVVELVIGVIDNKLKGIFWQSDEQVQLLSRFRDVCLLDMTCKTNRYWQPLALVIIVDNNTRSRLVAQALLPDESMDSFIWLFICLQKGNPTYEPGEHLDKENKYSHSQNTITFSHNSGSQSISLTLFPEIIELCEKYLTPHIVAEIKLQIQQALWYRCYLIDILQEHYNDESEFVNDQMCYGKSYGLLHTVLTLAMETETNEEVNNWCYQFIQQKREIQKLVSTTSEPNISTISDQHNNSNQENAIDEESVIQDENTIQIENTSQDENIIQVENTNQDEYIIQVTNPKVTASKGRPSGRQKSVLELEDRRPLKAIEENYN
ncbi:28174_t:CDS:2 [Dentiscutata erythropus]|uniref:28174_t:CDS:1 n=1 Tax=Dentiscutata erythropus TaxID=1348616 RepID=A0A9N9GCB9_9GLOM|nr:28174_t:CDS:2 [Dentiscutata erythropus]